MLLQKELSIESLYGRSNFVENFPQITEADPETLLVDTVVCMTTTQWWQIHFQNSFVSGSIFWGVGVGRYLQKLHPLDPSLNNAYMPIFGLQPRDKAAMLEAKTTDLLSKNLHENGV